MSLREARSNILTSLSAGHEATANTLAWSIFLLSQSPYWRARVRTEPPSSCPQRHLLILRSSAVDDLPDTFDRDR